MAAFLLHRDGPWWETRIGKGADGDGNHVGNASILPIDHGAAHGAETIRKDVAAVGRALPLGGLSGDSDLLPTKARLIADCADFSLVPTFTGCSACDRDGEGLWWLPGYSLIEHHSWMDLHSQCQACSRSASAISFDGDKT